MVGIPPAMTTIELTKGGHHVGDFTSATKREPVLGSLPSRTDAGPRSQWEVLPGITGTIQGRLREQLVLVGSLVVFPARAAAALMHPAVPCQQLAKDLMFDGG